MLNAQHLIKRYADYTAVGDVDVVLRRSEIVALLGRSGAGKTTIFQLLIGTIRPDAGEIILDGVGITNCPVYERARRGLSYLPQGSSVFPTMTVEQNLAMALEVCEKDRAQRQRAIEGLLTVFGLHGVRTTRAGKISGGERRRCEIARTMATSPRYVLLDEPFAGLDPLGIEDVRATVGLLKDYGVGVLITDHNVRETLRFVDRTYIIEAGQILAEGTTDVLLAHPKVRQNYLGVNFSC
jgi:lipopolysaccharide export system ATP-binding protein